MRHYPYPWTVNVSVGAPFGIDVRVWIGDVHWDWRSKQPLKIERVDTEQLWAETQRNLDKAIAEVLEGVQKQEPPR